MKWVRVVFVFTLAAMSPALHGEDGNRSNPVGPVCYPGGPCGSGGTIAASGPVCYPDGPCGNGQV